MTMLASLVLLLIGQVHSRPQRPHIIFHVIDDFGWDDPGFRNSYQIKTPTLNRFHEQGVTFDQYYVLPSCSPSRATFMSGRMPLHTGINNWIPNEAYGLPADETTLATLLGWQGYRCHAVGKWHLGFFKSEYTPTFRGFESFYGYYEGSEDYFLHTTGGGYDLHREGRPNCGVGCTQVAWDDAGEYSTNLFAAEAVRLIQAHNASEPLFLYQAWQGVHAPRQAPEQYVAPYQEQIQDEARRVFAGMVSAVDEGIGNITDALEAKGMLANSVVIVTTDNGGPVHECAGIGASNYPLRGGKCSIWEGGTRGTALLFAPSFLQQGFTWPGLMHAADWLPTLVEGVARFEIPRGATKPLDGFNLWHQLIGNLASPRIDLYYGIADASVGKHGPALRDAEGWKLILGTGGGTGDWPPQPSQNQSNQTNQTNQKPGGNDQRPRLFNLNEDPGEHCEVEEQQRITFMLELLGRYMRSAVPQATGDPSCPAFKPRKSLQGPWLGPWCDQEQLVV